MSQVTILLADCSVCTVITDVPDSELDVIIELITELDVIVSYMIESM